MRLRKMTAFLLSLALLLSLCSCGSSNTDTSSDAGSSSSALADAFSVQTSMIANYYYTVTYSLMTADGTDLGSVQRTNYSQGVFDLTTGDYTLDATITSSANEADPTYGTYTVYGVSADNACYFQSSDSDGIYSLDEYSSIFYAPQSLDLADCQQQSGSVLVRELTCDEYRSTTVPTSLRNALANLIYADGAISLANTDLELTLYVDRETGLLAYLKLELPNAADQALSYSEGEYTVQITECSLVINYTSYGDAVDVTPPDTFLTTVKENAGSEATETGTTGSDSTFWSIYSSDGTYAWQILQPEGMELDSSEDENLTFIFYYDSNHSFSIQYVLWEGATDADALNNAQTVAQKLASLDYYENVQESGIQTTTVLDQSLQYNILTYDYNDSESVVHYRMVYSWVTSTEDRGCLEIMALETDYSGEGFLFDEEDELAIAAQAVMGSYAIDE